MMSRFSSLQPRTARFVGTIVGLLLATGCRAQHVPQGAWSGEGHFVYEGWKKDAPADEAGSPGSIHRRYPTRMTIESSKLDGHEVLRLEIVSERGEIPGLYDRTHLIVALEQAKKIDEHTLLYRLVGAQMNPKPDEKLKYELSDPPYQAICSSNGDVTLLQVQYNENFIDTIRFSGSGVEKSGVLYDKGAGLVQWTESLKRK